MTACHSVEVLVVHYDIKVPGVREEMVAPPGNYKTLQASTIIAPGVSW